MPHPCHCGCIFTSEEERSKHQRTCPDRVISCCQSSQSCGRAIKDWIVVDESEQSSTSMATCRHASNGLFGAIREDNLDLVHHFLQQLKPNLADVLTHESRFGDTILSYSAALGRSNIVKALLKAIKPTVQAESNTLVVSDLVDYETSRGKVAIIEAVKSNNSGVVSILLSQGQANAKILSKTHKKSSLDWAMALGNESIARIIKEHTELQEKVCSLFKAVSKFDVSAVKLLTEGGVPFCQNQDATFRRELESKQLIVELARQSVNDIDPALQYVEQSLTQTLSGMYKRERDIEGLVKKREELVSSRRENVMQATNKVRLALATNSISRVCDLADPPLQLELISKALCILFHIKVKEAHPDPLEGEEHTVLHYWTEIKGLLLQNSSHFYHRIRHYHFEAHFVEQAANTKIDGLPGTCSDHLSSMLNKQQPRGIDLGSTLIAELANSWLWTTFQQVDIHKLEHDLVMQESSERDILERSRIDYDVLVSLSAILKRELDETKSSIDVNTKHISQLQRKLEVSKVMKFVTSGGHTILSWAAGLGNEEIVKILLNRGAHTAVGEDCLDWCATIIQVAFRHRRYPTKKPIERRRGCDLAVSLRIRSLSNLFRERLKSLRLPMAEALVNGHSKIALLLDKSDVPIFQAINLFPLFCQPSGNIPRPSINTMLDVSNEPAVPGAELLSSIIVAGQRHGHEQDPKDCPLVDSLKCGIDLVESFLEKRRNFLGAKLATRRETLAKKHRADCASELISAIYRGDFNAMVKASKEGGISLDFEDETTGLTPLLRAAQEDIHSPIHEWCRNSVGEKVTAVAFLLDRISRYRPNVDYENRLGHTAVSIACMKGHLEIVKDLIDRGADVNMKSSVLGLTAYELAVQENQLEVVEFLDQLR